MADDEDGPRSPPLARGAYNFNFDDLDAIDPFKPSKGLRNSPDKELECNPFESKAKLSSSPPINNLLNEDINPFQTKNKLGNSPPKANGFPENGDPIIADNENVHDNSADSFKTATDESPVKVNTGTFVKKKKKSPKKTVPIDNGDNEGHGDTVQDGGAEVEPKIPQKKPSPKKASGLKKPKARSKFKPPPNFGAKDTDDVVIFAPSPPTADNSSDAYNPSSVPDHPVDFPPPPTESEINPDTMQVNDANSLGNTEDNVDDSKNESVDNTKEPGDNTSEPSDNINESGENVIEPGDNTNEPGDNTNEPGDNELGENLNESGDSKNEPDDSVETVNDEPEGCQDGGGDLPTQMPDLQEVTSEGQVMMDSVHDFGAGEMPMDNNEEFVPAHEAFKEDDEAWQMMEKMNNEENAPAGRESLSAFDPLAETEVPDKVTRRSSEANGCSNSVTEDEDLILMNTPPSNKTSGIARGSRHPAARALQEQVEGDGAPKEAQVIDTMLYSSGSKGQDIKRTSEEHHEKYFDALEYPYSSRRANQGDNEVSRMNAANNKKHGGEGGQDSVVQLVQVLKYSQSDWNKMKQELELEYNAKILNKEREWSKKLADRDKKISYLDDQTLQLRSANEDMKQVVAEFDKTISQLQADKEKTTSETMMSFDDVAKERDQALEDLQSVETAFSDLHQRYERTKGVVEGLKKNEEILKKCVQDYQVKLKAAEDKAVSVRQQAEEKLDLASMEMEKLRKSTTAEMARMEAALKKSDLKIQGLERSLDQKVKENDELTAICDELIAKVGGD